MTSLASPTQSRVISLSGQINASNASQFREQLHKTLLATAPVELVLDMSQVEFLDSAGLMVLVNLLSAAQKMDSQLVLCCIPSSVQIILELTQLNRVFTILDASPVGVHSIEPMAMAA